MKELEDLIPKSIKFHSASDDLKEECFNFFRSLELQGKSKLTIVEYARTISNFITFLEDYLGYKIKLIDIQNLDKISINSYLAFYRNPEKSNFLKDIKYSFYDLMRSRWSYVYFVFYLLLGFTLLFLNNDLSKAVITLMNVIIILVPLIGTIFGVMYYYNSKEFTELLLAQPLNRSSIFLGQYLGVALSLSLSLVLGIGIPFVFYGLFKSTVIWDFSLLLISGTFLTFIFTSLAFNIALSNENKIKGFGYAILLWMLLAIVYDGVFLMSLIIFEDYPLDKLSLVGTILNPIDLSRTLILLKLDISALLGYTGAVFKKFFGTNYGLFISFLSLGLWVIVPTIKIVLKSSKKDF